jgi:hypothetical protein
MSIIVSFDDIVCYLIKFPKPAVSVRGLLFMRNSDLDGGILWVESPALASAAYGTVLRCTV